MTKVYIKKIEKYRKSNAKMGRFEAFLNPYLISGD